jgi:hypothetical protein
LDRVWTTRGPIGTLPLPAAAVVALVQINLKLDPDVAADWRRRAAEAGYGSSLRDWLLSLLSPTEQATGLAERVADLERAVADLQQQQASPAAPVPVVEQAANPRALPGTDTAVLATVEGIETASLARRLGIRPKTLADQVRRAGGGRPCLELYGWRCVGTVAAPRGGHPRALWVPAGTVTSTGSGDAAAIDPVPAAGGAGGTTPGPRQA